MTSADLITYAKEYGPAVLTITGSVISAIFAVVMWVLRLLWTKHKEEMKALHDSIQALNIGVTEYKDATTEEHVKIKETMNAYRAEMHLLKLTVDPLKAGLLTLEGAIKNQNDTIHRYVEKMGVVHGKLDAVFRFIDAPRRPTDCEGK